MNLKNSILLVVSLTLMVYSTFGQQGLKELPETVVYDFGIKFAKACDKDQYVLAFAHRACKNAGYKELYDIKDHVSKTFSFKESREIFFKQFYIEYSANNKLITALSMGINMEVDNAKILAKYIQDKYGEEERKENEKIAREQKVKEEKKKQQEKEKQNLLDRNKKEYEFAKSEIEKLFSEGVAEIKSGNFDEALTILQNASEKCNEVYSKTYEAEKPFKPFGNDIMLLQNKIYRELTIAGIRIEIKQLDKEINGNSKNGEAYLKRANCRVELLYNVMSDKKSQDSILVIGDINKAIELLPKSDEAYFTRGYLKGLVFLDYKGGIKDFDKTIKLNPNFATAFLYRSGLKGELGDEKGANADLKKYNELSKDKECEH